MKNDDAVLIQQILDGDKFAFNSLMQKYQKPIHAYVWRKIGDFHIAEEITQDIFLIVFNKLPTLKDWNSFVGWLYVIAARECFAWFEKKRPPTKSLDALPPEELETLAYTQYHAKRQEEYVGERQREVVEILLQKLPVSERKTVSLHYLDEMTCEDIGESMGVSTNTVKSRLHRARKRLEKEEHTIREIWHGNKGDHIMSTRIEKIQTKFNAYMQKVESYPVSSEDLLSGEEILQEALDEIEETLKDEITPQLVHLAVNDIYAHSGKIGMEKRITLLRKYLDVAPDDNERFWTHQHLMYSYANLKKNKEAIEEQKRLYRLADKNMSDKFALEAISNLNCAGAWKDEGRFDEWLQLYNAASKRLEKPEVSDYSRCDFLQIGAEVFRANERYDDALDGIEKLQEANKEQDWEHYFRFWLAVRTNKLLIYGKQEDWNRFDQVLADVSNYIKLENEKSNSGYPVNLSDLIWAAHDVGCCLVWTKRYDQAKRFLQISVDLQEKNDYGHFQLAVSIWASEKDREKTLHHLKLASDYVLNYWNQERYYPSFLETQEFSDVWDDQEFLSALGQ